MDTDRRRQGLLKHLSPDSPTLPTRGNSSAPRRDESSLKRSVLRIMDRLLNMGSPSRDSDSEEPDPSKTKMLRPEETPTVLEPDETHLSNSKTVTYDYIHMRFLRSIEQARADADDDEVLRLRRLLTLMENGEVHPVQAARYAWLNPAVREHH